MSGARVLSIGTPESFQTALDEAAALLRAREVVAIPTETVYGLAANALDAEAVGRIFSIKGRPAQNPVIVHVDGIETAQQCAAVWPRIANDLAARFWPGPLTLVLARSDKIPDVVTAGGATVGLRWPAHPFVEALIRKCGFPLAAPSANPAGQLSATTAEHVRRHLGTRIPLIIDGGPTRVGIESTVVDVSVFPPRILRPGMIDAAAIQSAAKAGLPTIHDSPFAIRHSPRVAGSATESEMLRSPGLLEKHYSPRAKLVIGSWAGEAELRELIERSNVTPEKIHLLAYRAAPQQLRLGRADLMPSNVSDFARVLYDQLHRCDEMGAELIIVEAPPNTGEWEPIWDRLRRAAA